LKADEEMPSGVYTVIHGTRRRSRPLPVPKDRALWPYAVAAALFIAALSMLLRTPEPPISTLVVRQRSPEPQPLPTPAKVDLEARRVKQQEVSRQLDRKEEELTAARRQAEAQKEEQAQRELE